MYAYIMKRAQASLDEKRGLRDSGENGDPELTDKDARLLAVQFELTFNLGQLQKLSGFGAADHSSLFDELHYVFTKQDEGDQIYNVKVTPKAAFSAEILQQVDTKLEPAPLYVLYTDKKLKKKPSVDDICVAKPLALVLMSPKNQMKPDIRSYLLAFTDSQVEWQKITQNIQFNCGDTYAFPSEKDMVFASKQVSTFIDDKGKRKNADSLYDQRYGSAAKAMSRQPAGASSLFKPSQKKPVGSHGEPESVRSSSFASADSEVLRSLVNQAISAVLNELGWNSEAGKVIQQSFHKFLDSLGGLNEGKSWFDLEEIVSDKINQSQRKPYQPGKASLMIQANDAVFAWLKASGNIGDIIASRMTTESSLFKSPGKSVGSHGEPESVRSSSFASADSEDLRGLVTKAISAVLDELGRESEAGKDIKQSFHKFLDSLGKSNERDLWSNLEDRIAEAFNQNQIGSGQPGAEDRDKVEFRWLDASKNIDTITASRELKALVTEAISPVLDKFRPESKAIGKIQESFSKFLESLGGPNEAASWTDLRTIVEDKIGQLQDKPSQPRVNMDIEAVFKWVEASERIDAIIASRAPIDDEQDRPGPQP